MGFDIQSFVYMLKIKLGFAPDIYCCSGWACKLRNGIVKTISYCEF